MHFIISDWKSRTKSKAAIINRSRGQTGGGRGVEFRLSEFVKRLLQLMGTLCYMGTGPAEFGLTNTVNIMSSILI